MFGVAPFTALTHADHGEYAKNSAEAQQNVPKRPSTALSFREDQRLVGLRYDQTREAEPPVPIIPARSPLRPTPRPTHPKHPTHRASRSLDCPPQRPSSCLLVPGNGGVPPPRPPRPDEEHPALRTITSGGTGSQGDDWNWDYGQIRPPPIPPSQSVWEESDEEGDELDRISSRLKIAASLRLGPRPKAASLDSIEEGAGRRSESSTSQVSVPLSSPSLSDSNTLSTTTTANTTTPSTPASEHFADKLAKSLSIRSHKSSKAPIKQLKKRPPKKETGVSTDHWIIGQ